jgi:hypothetical protein
VNRDRSSFTRLEALIHLSVTYPIKGTKKINASRNKVKNIQYYIVP